MIHHIYCPVSGGRRMSIHEQFVQDMKKAGHEVEHYRGRFFYEGPAVKCERDELQDVIRATQVKLQWDHLGRTGLVVYPR